MDEKIIFRDGAQKGNEFQISDEDITIGRGLENSIVIDDIQISRNHMRIFRKDDGIYIKDLKSTNGTLLNGKALKKTQKLRNGDTVTIGESNIFEVQIPGEAPKEKPARREKAVVKEQPEDEKVEKKGKFSFLKKEKKERKPKEKSAKEPRKIAEKYPTWAIVLMIALGFIIVFCVIPFVIIEASNQWCNIFANFFNAIKPGVCP
jgi:pSer/pThr/pTyr-binding forkhead associated (FHA) protein